MPSELVEEGLEALAEDKTFSPKMRDKFRAALDQRFFEDHGWWQRRSEPRMTVSVLDGLILLTRNPWFSQWAIPELRGGSDDASAGILPRLRDHLRSGRPSSWSTPCLPLGGTSSLARDP